MSYKAAIFDLDGTILDTVTDLKNAINYAMKETGHKCDFTSEEAKLFFGSGPYEAIKRALTVEAGWGYDTLLDIGTENEKIPDSITLDEIKKIIDIYYPYYNAHNEDNTGPYEGISDVLMELKDSGIVLAVVSNKPDNDTQVLINKIFPGIFDVIVGQKEGIRRKPYPDMTLAVMDELSLEKNETVYVGDSEIDYETAINSGLDCISVTWGFRTKEYLRSIGASCIVDSAEELMGIITGQESR